MNHFVYIQAASKQGKIYIGKFTDPTISEDVIKEHFSQYGQVVEIQRPVDRSKNSEPKNFCFITFDKEEPANALLKEVSLIEKSRVRCARGKSLLESCGTIFLPD